MQLSKKKKKILIVSGISILILTSLYVFFMKTNRGSSIALYVVGGWGAPISTRFECGKETDILVAKKFLNPPPFDKKSINGLKGFWYYSYYRQCLYQNGFDFNGDKIPTSTLRSSGVYANPLAGITFKIEKAMITADNVIDVDDDDRLRASKIQIPEGTLFVNSYLKNNDILNFEELVGAPKMTPTVQGNLLTQIITKNPQGIDMLEISQDNDTVGFLFMTPEKHIIYIYGATTLKSIIDQIESSISYLTK